MERPFPQSLAVVVGIDDYRHGVPRLRNAGRDARRLAWILAKDHGYKVLPLSQGADRQRILHLLAELRALANPEDRVLFYFAGHGVAFDDDRGLSGFLVPEDARPDQRETLFSMDLLKRALDEVPHHHLLVILDCCFAGAFRWSMTRDSDFFYDEVHYELYQRFVQDPAWQIITSSAHDQKARDVSWRLGARDEDHRHSPFAQALFQGLQGAADLVPAGGDGLITVHELHTYLREEVQRRTAQDGSPQTPGFWSMLESDKGEYVFEVPGRELNLPPAPKLDQKANPYRGLEPFEAEHEDLFFGRFKLLQSLVEVVRRSPLTVVTGASGAGKSSLVRAGLVPAARRWRPRWQIVGPLRPGERPLASLTEALEALELLPATRFPFDRVLRQKPRALMRIFGAWLERHAEARWLVIVDQLEELVTLGRDDGSGLIFEQILAAALDLCSDRLRLVLTVRSDVAHRFVKGPLGSRWRQGRLIVPPMSHHELRQAILGPAARKVLRFDSEELVHELIEEMVLMPGALPLLSFTLSELYRAYVESGRTDRTLSRQDYDLIGGVEGSLRGRAEEEWARLDDASQAALRKVLLRMVGVEHGEPTRRRVPLRELTYRDEADNERVKTVLGRFIAARLLAPDGDFVEPAHDRLLSAWDRLADWARDQRQTLQFHRRVTRAADDWTAADKDPAHLWSGSRLLELRRLSRLPGDWLNLREHELLSASERSHRFGRLRVAAVAVGMLLVAGLAAWWWRLEVSVRLADKVESEMKADQHHHALLLARRAYELDRQAGGRQSARGEQALRRALDVSMPSEVLYRSPDPGSQPLLALSPTESLLAVAFGSELLLIDVEVGVESKITLEADTDGISALAFNPGGQYLVTAHEQGNLRLWYRPADSTGTWRSTSTAPGTTQTVQELAFVPGGEDLITLEKTATGSRIRFWRIVVSEAGEPVLQARPEAVHQHSALLASIAVHPQGTTLIAVGPLPKEYGAFYLWPLDSFPDGPREFRFPAFSPNSVAISDDGRFLFAGSLNGELGQWRLADLDQSPVITSVLPSNLESIGSVVRVVTLPDSSWVLSAHQDGKIGWWNWRRKTNWWDPDPNYPSIISAYCDNLKSIAVSHDSRFLVSGCDGTLRLWRRTDGRWNPRDTPSRRNLGSEVTAIAFHPTEAGLLAVGIDEVPSGGKNAPPIPGGIFLWNLREPQPRRIARYDGPIETLAFDAAGAHLLAVGAGRIRLHQLSGNEPDSPVVKTRTDRLVALDDEGVLIVAVDEASRIRLYRMETSDEVLLPKGDWTVDAVALQPGGKLVAAVGDGALHTWRVAPDPSEDSQIWIPGESASLAGAANVLAFSHDGRQLAVAGVSQSSPSVWLFQVDSLGHRPRRLEPLDTEIGDLEFSPNGLVLAAGMKYASVVRLWSLDFSEPAVRDLTDYSEYPVGSLGKVSFSADGRTVAALDTGGRTVYLWAIDTSSVADQACRTLGPELIREDWQRLVGSKTRYEPICQDLAEESGE